MWRFNYWRGGFAAQICWKGVETAGKVIYEVNK